MDALRHDAVLSEEARIVGGIGQVLGDLVLGDPTRDALAELDAQLFRRLVDVFPDLALHGDWNEVVVGQPVHADVVVVDQLP